MSIKLTPREKEALTALRLAHPRSLSIDNLVTSIYGAKSPENPRQAATCVLRGLILKTASEPEAVVKLSGEGRGNVGRYGLVTGQKRTAK